MNKFFSPASVAIVGASAKTGKTGHAILHNIIQGGFSGEIYPINPREKSILGKPAFPSLTETPQPAELAVIVIPAQIVPAIVKEGAEIGIKNFVIITAGFGEIGEAGALLDTELQKLIKKYDLKIMGPNCLGVIDPYTQLNAAFGGALPQKGNVALVSQSGAIVSSLCDWSGIRGFGFSKIISLGNKLQLNENECLEYLGNDTKTEVITLFIKHFINRYDFLRLAKKISRTKRIILYKSGTKDLHDESLNKELREAGIIRVNTLEDLYNVTHICSTLPIPTGNNVSIITNSGGPGIIAADAVNDSPRIHFSEFTPETKDLLIKALPKEALPENPVDLIGDAKADLYEASLDILLKTKSTHALLVILCPQTMTQPIESAQAIIDAKRKYPQIPIVTCFMGGKTVLPGINLLTENGIPCFLDPAKAVWALETLAILSEIQNT